MRPQLAPLSAAFSTRERMAAVNHTTPREKDNKQEGSTDFLIKIMFCKNTSWQGEIYRLDSSERVSFRSALELLELIKEALEENNNPAAEYTLRSWTEVRKEVAL